MANTDQIIRSLMNRGKSVRNIEEPWWSKQYGSSLENINKSLQNLQNINASKSTRARDEVSIIDSYQARISNLLRNYKATNKVYTESGIQSLKKELDNLKERYAGDFPQLIAEFNASNDANKDTIDDWSDLNKRLKTFDTKFPVAQKELNDTVNELSKTEWKDFKSEDRSRYAGKLYKQVEDVLRMKSLLENPYFQEKEGWSDKVASFNVGFLGGYQELLKQIHRYDADDFVLTKQEKNSLERALSSTTEVGLSEIQAINSERDQSKQVRMKTLEKDYINYLTQYENIDKITNTYQYQAIYKKRQEEYENLIKDGKTVPSDFWNVSAFDIYGGSDPPENFPESIDMQSLDMQLGIIQKDAETINEDYRLETYSNLSLSEFQGKPLPWVVRAERLKVQEENKIKQLTNNELKKKNKLLQIKKVQQQGNSELKHFDRNNILSISGDEYKEYSRPNSSKERLEVASALGENNYQDVWKKYLSANPDVGFPPKFDRVGYRPTNIKREDAETQLNNILRQGNTEVSNVATYIANNNSRQFEREFQKFLDGFENNEYSARDIIGNFAISTYKLQDNPIANFAASFQPNAINSGAATWALTPSAAGDPSAKIADKDVGWRIVRGYKKGNPKLIEKNLKNYYTVGSYEALALLYQFMGTRGAE